MIYYQADYPRSFGAIIQLLMATQTSEARISTLLISKNRAYMEHGLKNWPRLIYYSGGSINNKVKKFIPRHPRSETPGDYMRRHI